MSVFWVVVTPKAARVTNFRAENFGTPVFCAAHNRLQGKPVTVTIRIKV